MNLNFTSKTRIEVNEAINYVSSFTFVIMAAVWLKIFIPIDLCNKVLQARDATLDVEVTNMQNLISDLQDVYLQWKKIWKETEYVAYNLDIEIKLKVNRVRKLKTFQDEINPDDDGGPMEISEDYDFKQEAIFR